MQRVQGAGWDVVEIPARLLASLARRDAGERERQAWAALSDLVRGSVGLEQPDAVGMTQAAGSGAREMAALEEEPTRTERAHQLRAALSARAAADVEFAAALRAWAERTGEPDMLADPVESRSGHVARDHHRSRLIALVRRSAAAARALGRGDTDERLLRQSSALANDRFRVAVVGPSRAGKSTLINSLMGAEVLSHERGNAVATEVSYGPAPTAYLYPALSGGSPPPPRTEVAVQDVAAHLTPGYDSLRPDARYERAEIRWPAELCRDGLVLVDSPGLNAERPYGWHDRAEAVRDADLLIVVLTAGAPLLYEESRFLGDRLRARQSVPVFLVVNKEDLVAEDQRSALRALLREQVTPLMRSGDELFFVQARGALIAREGQDGAAITDTGVPELERALLQRAATQRRPALLRSARDLGMAVDSLVGSGHDALGVLRSEQAVLAERHRQAVHEGATLVERTRERVVLEGERFFNHVADECPRWAAEAQLTAKVTLRVHESLRARADELASLLLQRAQQEVDIWSDAVQNRLEDVVRQLGDLFGTEPVGLHEDSFMPRILAATVTPISASTLYRIQGSVPLPGIAQVTAWLISLASFSELEARLRADVAAKVATALRKSASHDAEEVAALAVEPLRGFLLTAESHGPEGIMPRARTVRRQQADLVSCLDSLHDIEAEYRLLVEEMRAAEEEHAAEHLRLATGGRQPWAPRLTLRSVALRVGEPVVVEVRLEPTIPGGAATEGKLPPMVLVSSALSPALLEPPAIEYAAEGAPAAFNFIAREPGAHRLRFTVYDRDLGRVLQDFEAIVDVPAPLLAPVSGTAGGGSS
ncbi:dynamin family protein [Streptomyces sp. NPDC057099]|uniref:dynamin family protein n=1 Tax=Streptomyces sp. NPDC057099 TaxID=3346019 RepID=UPI00363ED4FF